MAYHRQQGLDTSIVRIFNTYGSRMRPHDGRAIPTFLRQALQDRPLTVFGERRADAQLLLRRRPDPRHRRAGRVRRAPAGQHRQPQRVHASGTGEDGDRGHRVALGDRLRGAAGRRSRSSAGPTSAAPATCSAGSRRSSSTRACGGRSTTPASSASSALPTEHRAQRLHHLSRAVLPEWGPTGRLSTSAASRSAIGKAPASTPSEASAGWANGGTG